MSSRQPESKLRPIDPKFWTVENELSDPIPVSTPELEVLEQHFGCVLDAVVDFRPRAFPATITASQKGKKK